MMRRPHSTLMKTIKAAPRLIADQMGHTLDVNQNVYMESCLESGLPLAIANQLEELVL